LLAFLLALCALQAGAAGALGAAALKAKYESLGPQLASNQFGGPLVLESEEQQRRIDGNVYAVLDHPFAQVSAALSDPAQWCDILILHLNTKYCRIGMAGPDQVLDLRVGRKTEQEVEAASLLRFGWKPPTARGDYFGVTMGAPEGPYGTRDYTLLAEAVPLPGNRTFLHMAYGLSYGTGSYIAMQLYLGTTGRDKVGFTRADASQGGEDGYIGGMRGIVERNTMRYYLAINTYLDSLAAPAPERLERRLAAWFDATEKYARQLHEVERDDYLRMKRNEVQRQAAAR
jgi:hypothetical protein